jgi:hypothetical protein
MSREEASAEAGQERHSGVVEVLAPRPARRTRALLELTRQRSQNGAGLPTVEARAAEGASQVADEGAGGLSGPASAVPVELTFDAARAVMDRIEGGRGAAAMKLASAPCPLSAGRASSNVPSGAGSMRAALRAEYRSYRIQRPSHVHAGLPGARCPPADAHGSRPSLPKNRLDETRIPTTVLKNCTRCASLADLR